MKLFFLISDVNSGLIIGGVITAVVTPLIGIAISYLKKIIDKQDNIISNTDGMKTELVSATAALNEAIGIAKGRAELKQEIADKQLETPTKVVIEENRDKEVIIKKNLDK